MRYIISLVTISLIVLSGNSAAQQVYKCSHKDGSITFSDKPCGDNAQSLYIENSQSGISTNQSYYKPLTERAERNRAARNSDSARTARAHREAEREYERVLKETNNSRAATRAASVAMSKANNSRGAEAQREYKRMIKQGYNSAAAERAANVILGQPVAPSVDEPMQPSISSNQNRMSKLTEACD